MNIPCVGSAKTINEERAVNHDHKTYMEVLSKIINVNVLNCQLKNSFGGKGFFFYVFQEILASYSGDSNNLNSYYANSIQLLSRIKKSKSSLKFIYSSWHRFALSASLP